VSRVPLVQPRHVLCVLGNWTRLEAVEEIVRAGGGPGFTVDREYSQLAFDIRMPRAFEASADRVAPSLSAEDEAAILDHAAVAYVLSPPMPAEQAIEVSTQALAVVGSLFENGALAVKNDSSGVAHGAARWRELATRAAGGDAGRQRSALYQAWVRRPIEGDGELYSCGMHLLGLRDGAIASALGARQGLHWLDMLALYQLIDVPDRGLREGEDFRLAPDGPRRTLRATPCRRYESDDLFHNRYGYWQLTDPS
jgi:hypothetical protein